MTVKAKRKLKNAQITHVSYVDKGANQRSFYLTKSDTQPVFDVNVKLICKEEDEQKLVYGVVYEPNVVDAHGDFMTADEIEKAAHGFLKDYRQIDKQHDFQSGVGEVVESYVAPADMELGGQTVTKGTWLLVTKATDEVWESIKSGEITGYSFAGTAEVEEVAKAEETEEQTFFKMVKAFFTKGAVKDKFTEENKSQSVWVAWDSFRSVIRTYDYNTGKSSYADEATIREAVSDLSDLLNQILLSDNIIKALGDIPEDVEKAGKKISTARLNRLQGLYSELGSILSEVEEKEAEEEVEVTKEELMKTINEALEPITQKLDTLEKSDKEVEQKVDEVEKEAKETQEDLAKSFAEVLKEQLAPINDRLETLEKARGVKKSAEVEKQEEVVKEEELFNSLFTFNLGGNK